MQEHDTVADRLRHRQASLPERAELASREAATAAVDARLQALQPTGAEAAGRQSKLEAELSSVEAKIAAAQQRLYSGASASPRDLQALEADIRSMQRHQSRLEDEVLEAMQEVEPLDRETERLVEERSRLQSEADALRNAIGVASVTIEAELATVMAERTTLASALPPDLVALYDTLRRKLGGVGAARLVNGSCGGCHMVLPAIELDSIRHQSPEVVVRCDQCGRILVR